MGAIGAGVASGAGFRAAGGERGETCGTAIGDGGVGMLGMYAGCGTCNGGGGNWA